MAVFSSHAVFTWNVSNCRLPYMQVLLGLPWPANENCPHHHLLCTSLHTVSIVISPIPLQPNFDHVETPPISSIHTLLLSSALYCPFVLTLLHDFRLETSQTWPWPSYMTLTYHRPETYSKLLGMFENHIIESNIIEVDQVVPEICHFQYFPWVTAAILDFGLYKCQQLCNLRFF